MAAVTSRNRKMREFLCKKVVTSTRIVYVMTKVTEDELGPAL